MTLAKFLEGDRKIRSAASALDAPIVFSLWVFVVCFQYSRACPISKKRIYQFWQCTDNVLILHSKHTDKLGLASYNCREFEFFNLHRIFLYSRPDTDMNIIAFFVPAWIS